MTQRKEPLRLSKPKARKEPLRLGKYDGALKLGQPTKRAPLRLSDAPKPKALQLSPDPAARGSSNDVLRLGAPIGATGRGRPNAKPTAAQASAASPFTAAEATEWCRYMNSPEGRREREKLRAELAPQILGRFSGRVIGAPLELAAVWLKGRTS